MTIKVAICARTLNAELHVDRFCKAYDWADDIFVADGGSTDYTLLLLAKYPKVTLLHFDEWVQKPGFTVKRNPEGKHINFALDAGEASGADWLIHDDIDSAPNANLQHAARRILEASVDNTRVFVPRLYLWGEHEHFPRLAGPEQGYGIWAWRPGVVRWSEEDPFIPTSSVPLVETTEGLRIGPPYCLLHYFCLTPTEAERKLAFYRENGQNPGHKHWLEACGPVEPLPEWAAL